MKQKLNKDVTRWLRFRSLCLQRNAHLSQKRDEPGPFYQSKNSAELILDKQGENNERNFKTRYSRSK